MNNQTNENLAKQRTAAIGVKEVQPGVEEIRFVEEGSVDGGGNWSVSTKIIIAGKEYKEILTKDGLGGGEPLPEGNTGTKTPVKVIYSDGKGEILE